MFIFQLLLSNLSKVAFRYSFFFFSFSSCYNNDSWVRQRLKANFHSQTSFKAYNPNKPGPLNGMQTNTAYVTKDLLQAKRFKAQNMGTTYVYDFLKLLKRALNTVWEDWAKKAGWGVSIPETLVRTTIFFNVLLHSIQNHIFNNCCVGLVHQCFLDLHYFVVNA